PDVAAVRLSMSSSFAGVDRTEGLSDALDAEEIGRSHLRLMLRHLPERQGLEYAASRPKGTDLAVSIALTSDRYDSAPIFDALIRSRGLVFDEIASRRHASAEASQSDLAPLWTTLVSTRQRFANLVIRGADTRQYERHLSLLEEARREKEQAERALADKSATCRAGR